MDEIKHLKAQIDSKSVEIDNLERELNNKKYVLNELDRNFDNLLYKEIYENNKEIYLSQHKHYKENHVLSKNINFYYDKYWIKKTYSKMWARNNEGRLHSYEGPDKMVIITCTQCKMKCEYTYKSKDYEGNIEKLNDDCENEFDDLLLYEIHQKFNYEL